MSTAPLILVSATRLDADAFQRDSLLGRCLGCMATYSPQAEQGYRSPCCSHPREEIIHGRELRIRSVDYDLSTPSP